MLRATIDEQQEVLALFPCHAFVIAPAPPHAPPHAVSLFLCFFDCFLLYFFSVFCPVSPPLPPPYTLPSPLPALYSFLTPCRYCTRKQRSLLSWPRHTVMAQPQPAAPAPAPAEVGRRSKAMRPLGIAVADRGHSTSKGCFPYVQRKGGIGEGLCLLPL